MVFSCGEEGSVGYKLLLRLCSKTKMFILRVYFNLFFQPEAIPAFTSDPALVLFADYFCKPTVNMGQV